MATVDADGGRGGDQEIDSNNVGIAVGAGYGDGYRKRVDAGQCAGGGRDSQAAEAARCAGDQEKFWPMHDALFRDASKLGKNGLIESAENLKLDMTVFRSCLESGKHKLEVQNDMQVASSLQINGTPSFLIGKAIGEELSGAIIAGAQPFSVFEARLRDASPDQNGDSVR